MPAQTQFPKRGAGPSPRSALAAATPHVAAVGAPPNFITIPQTLSFWGNYDHGDCVTAEEAFAKACNQPEIFISEQEAINWATQHGVLEGAYLTQVMQWMQTDGFVQDGFTYDDGPYYSVDWTNAATLQSAISQGPVKIGVAADQLNPVWHNAGGGPNGGVSGWFATGFHADSNEDHNPSLCGYGTIAWLAQQLNVQVPSGVDGTQPGYAMFTWDSIGIIDVPSLLAITHEAWVRIPTTIVVQQAGTSTIHVFARGGDGAVWHNWQTAPNNGWSGWYSLGGWIDLLAAAQNADGRLEIFARGGDGAVWHNWETTPGGSWSGWYSLGGWIDILTVAQNADGRLEIFARGGDGAVWHNWQTAPSNGWSGWYSLGGWIDRLDVSSNADGRLEIFARGGDGAVWHNWQTAPNNGWSGWYSLGGWIDMLALARNADGRLEIFARGGDGALWHNWQTAPNNGWSGWYSLGGWIDLLYVARNADGRLEIFARGGDGAVWHNWQTAPNNGWSGWYSLGGWIDRLDVSDNADGRLEIFARGGDGALWHNWQTAPNNGWSGWYSLGGWIDMLEVWPKATGIG
jgi:hypothetical protein